MRPAGSGASIQQAHSSPRYDADGRLLCSAHRKGSGGEPCRGLAVRGSSKCRMHGGTNPGGRIKTGRYSRGLRRAAKSYEESLNDGALLDLRETIALLDVQVQKSAERVGELDTPEYRAKALDLLGEVEQAEAEEDEEGRKKSLAALGVLLRQGAAEDVALERMALSAERMAKRIEAAWKVLLDKSQAIPREHLKGYATIFFDLARRHLSDSDFTRVVWCWERAFSGDASGPREVKEEPRVAAG